MWIMQSVLVGYIGKYHTLRMLVGDMGIMHSVRVVRIAKCQCDVNAKYTARLSYGVI